MAGTVLNASPVYAVKVYAVTPEQMAAAFEEWDRRYRANPEEFMSEVARLLGETPESYGAACAAYFAELLEGK